MPVADARVGRRRLASLGVALLVPLTATACVSGDPSPVGSTPPALSPTPPPDSAGPAGPAAEPTPGWPEVSSGIALPEHPLRDTGEVAGAGGPVGPEVDGMITYTVVEGDQLGQVAARFYPDDPIGLALNLLGAVNEPGPLAPGDEIALPSGSGAAG